MPYYVISYDLRKQRNYQPLWDMFNGWKAKKVLESVWLAELKGPASEVRDAINTAIDSDDGSIVIELKPGFDWAGHKPLPAGTEWLREKSP